MSASPPPAPRHTRLTEKLTALSPVHLEVVDESDQHNVPPGSESHFRVLIVCADFAGERPLARQRRINALLADEFEGGLHALALQALAPEEWRAGSKARSSPPCLGGSSARKATRSVAES